MLVVAEPFLARNMHPTVLVNAYQMALEEALRVCESLAVEIDTSNKEEMRSLIRSCIGTKFVSRYGDLMCDLALEAVTKVAVDEDGRKEIDIKRYARVEKLPGGELDECRVLDGVMFNKDVTHARMPRRIENPRIVLLDCPLEYKKLESQANLEFANEEDFEAMLKQEEDWIHRAVNNVLAVKPDIVVTEKGVSELASHYFIKAGVAVIRRIRKTDNNRVARATGATVVHRPEELEEGHVGTGCGLFEVRKFGDEYFCFMEECKDPKACTILLRGGSKDVLNELERNLQDAMQVARNVVLEPKLLPGGGATEMAISVALAEAAKSVGGVEQWPFRAVGAAMEVIPRTLAQNCGADTVRLITELRAAKAGGAPSSVGIDGDEGKLADMSDVGVWDPFVVKTQTIKTAVESACMLLRIDDVVSGVASAARKEDERRGAAGRGMG
jgi:T-complex protein 1 subunit gamma